MILPREFKTRQASQGLQILKAAQPPAKLWPLCSSSLPSGPVADGRGRRPAGRESRAPAAANDEELTGSGAGGDHHVPVAVLARLQRLHRHRRRRHRTDSETSRELTMSMIFPVDSDMGVNDAGRSASALVPSQYLAKYWAAL
jgi:hypothetical protein